MLNSSSSLSDILASIAGKRQGRERRLIVPREYHDEIRELRRLSNLSRIKVACLMAANHEAMSSGDYERAVRAYEELEDARVDHEWANHNLSTRIGQILPKIPVHALQRSCCAEHGLEIELNNIEDMIYVHWKEERCDGPVDTSVEPAKTEPAKLEPPVDAQGLQQAKLPAPVAEASEPKPEAKKGFADLGSVLAKFSKKLQSGSKPDDNTKSVE